MKVLSGHKSCVRDVSWHPYNLELVSSSWDFTVNKWEGVETSDKEEGEGDRKTMHKEKEKRKVEIDESFFGLF